METVVEEIVPPEDLKKFERLYNKEAVEGKVSSKTTFEYAWCLIRSRYLRDMQKGVILLEDLYVHGDDESQRDYLFYLAIGNYRLKEYTKALNYIRAILKNEPKNHQALELEKLIKKKMNREGLMGMAIVGGAALALGSLVGLGVALAKKS
ncbi:mitochondrial fission 1 protein-like [Saccoglossus kowalevskii]|uniref:Mitochondrial fission 1 protein n=1 Tax=Saccoglossus kowalevskii TaxID=10224 RepID=A0ABM0GP86_SACKO|nr:PREDICTED: mitochondrial fission 1 protein-like [Saccoglossus kowalevskii]